MAAPRPRPLPQAASRAGSPGAGKRQHSRAPAAAPARPGPIRSERWHPRRAGAGCRGSALAAESPVRGSADWAAAGPGCAPADAAGGGSPAQRRGCLGAALGCCPASLPSSPGPSLGLPVTSHECGARRNRPARPSPAGGSRSRTPKEEGKGKDRSLSVPDVVSEGNQTSPFHSVASPRERGAVPWRGCRSARTGGLSSTNPRREAGKTMSGQNLALPRALVKQAPAARPRGRPGCGQLRPFLFALWVHLHGY